MTPRPLEPSPERLLSGRQARELLSRRDPQYGREFSEAEWDAVAERLSMLTRLYWDIGRRERARRGGVRGAANAEAPDLAP